MTTVASPITPELGIILETRTEDGTLLRRWVEPWGSSLDAEWLDKLADQQMWDYERHGKTETFIVLPCGDLPLSALRALPEQDETDPNEGNDLIDGLDDPQMGSIDHESLGAFLDGHGTP